MKKKLLFIGLLLVAISISLSYSYSEKNRLGSLMLENIEALASGEWGSDAKCIGSGSVDCPINHYKVRFVASYNSLEELY